MAVYTSLPSLDESSSNFCSTTFATTGPVGVSLNRQPNFSRRSFTSKHHSNLLLVSDLLISPYSNFAYDMDDSFSNIQQDNSLNNSVIIL